MPWNSRDWALDLQLPGSHLGNAPCWSPAVHATWRYHKENRIVRFTASTELPADSQDQRPPTTRARHLSRTELLDESRLCWHHVGQKNCSAEPSQPSESWEIISGCGCFKPLSLGMVWYIATDGPRYLSHVPCHMIAYKQTSGDLICCSIPFLYIYHLCK